MATASTQAVSNQAQAGASSAQASSHSDTPQALKSWWAGFKNRRKGPEPRAEQHSPPPAPGIFGIPLADSIKYANVAISLIDDNGQSFTYGYVPIVVAKCGVFLKEKATDVEGIFRLSGSSKRIKELQTAFDSPDRYGKGLDWTGYTVHDAANVLRRYLNNLPQPIVPLEFYERFREPLRHHSAQLASSEKSGTHSDHDLDHDKAIATYQQLITEIPPLNRQLLLYILDLLAVFASKSNINLMTSANLSAIFQPGVLSHPTHDMSPEAYRLSQDVLIFLIDNQDSFLIGMSGTAADEKTVREVQSGAIPQQPSTPSKTGLGRSASNGSNAGEGKRFSGLRRNVSTSSRNSRQSSQGPATPLSGHFGNSPVHRSNTVPSKKSPALPTSRFNRGTDSPSTPLAPSPAIGTPSNQPAAFQASETKTENKNPGTVPAVEGLGLSQAILPTETPTADGNNDIVGTTENSVPASNQFLGPPTKTRKVSDVLLNLTGGADKDGRQPNKLKKKRLQSNPNASGNSSTASLVGPELSPGFPPARSPIRTPEVSASDNQDPIAALTVDSADLTPTANETEPHTPVPSFSPAAQPEQSENDAKLKTLATLDPHQSGAALRARSGSRTSAHSRSSVTDLSELDHDQTEEARAQQKEKKRRWRFSSSAKKSKSPARVGTNAGAEQSSSSVGSWHRSRKSVSNEPYPPTFEPIPSLPMTTTTITGGTPKARSRSRGKSRDPAKERLTEDEKEEKQGFFDKLKKKVNQVREDKRERDAEKERAKSPQRETERSGSKHSLSAIVNEPASPRRPSVVQQTIPEQVETEAAAIEKPVVSEQTQVAESITAKQESIPHDEVKQTATTVTQPSDDPSSTTNSAALPTTSAPEKLASTEVEKPSEAPVQASETSAVAVGESSTNTESAPAVEHVVEQQHAAPVSTTEAA